MNWNKNSNRFLFIYFISDERNHNYKIASIVTKGFFHFIGSNWSKPNYSFSKMLLLTSTNQSIKVKANKTNDKKCFVKTTNTKLHI